MNSTIRNTKSLQGILKRLEAFLKIPGTPSDVKSNLLLEIDSLKWVIDIINDQLWIKFVILIVDEKSSFLSDIGLPDLPRAIVTVNPSQTPDIHIFLDLFQSDFNPIDKSPVNINPKGYRRCIKDDQVMLIEGSINKQWFADLGTDNAKSALEIWAHNVFEQVKFHREKV